MSHTFTALLLAGRRGSTDPVAQSVGCSHKILVPVVNVPMIVRVLRTLDTATCIDRIVVSTDAPMLLENFTAIRKLVESGVVEFHVSADSPAASVLDYCQQHAKSTPLLVTTADHPLLTSAMVEYFCAEADRSGADVVAGLVAESLFRSQYPQSQRSFIPLRGDSFCGTNLFALCTPRATAAVRFWEHAGQFRKRPWRLIKTFGLMNFLLLATKRLDLAAALPRVSRVLGARAAAVTLPYAECAIDVDTLDDLATVTRILRDREAEEARGVTR
ncbi:MAG: NTP transferase domain-containing protein [Candidatus Binatia bacterium]